MPSIALSAMRTNSQTGTGQAITIQSNQGRLNPGNGGQQATMQYTSSIGPNCAMKGRFKPPRASRDVVRIDTSQPLKRSLAKIERALLRI